MSLTLGMTADLLVLTNQSTIISIFFPRHAEPVGQNAHAPRQRHKSGRRLALQSGVDPHSLQLNHAASRGSSDGFGAADDVHFGEDAFHV
jgi:hypothetical protein